jgi:hypothetical protein
MSPPVTERADITRRPTPLEAFLRARKHFLPDASRAEPILRLLLRA